MLRTKGAASPLLAIDCFDTFVRADPIMLIRLSFFSSKTPLHWSAEYGHFETCHRLLQLSANLQSKDKR